ncbi:MAG TPA: ATP-binding cassette domain-containing protein [Polyangiaceae bacterium]|nr:ATP-binding cassette domain-containing protein [Polyangiaceae bacterium]
MSQLFEPQRSFEPGITLDRVHFRYDRQLVLDGVDWDLGLGRAVVITGQNGCGKSTLLYIAAGLLAPQRGTVLLGGHPIHGLLPSERFRRGLRVGFVFQEGGLLANMTAMANVSLALHYHADVLDLSEEQIKLRCEAAFEQAQIRRSDWDRLPAHMSFGNRKRLALARAMAIQPNFFFFDDPDVGLDQRTATVIHQLLVQLRDDPQVTLVVGTNRAALMDRLEVPGYRLDNGHLGLRDSSSSLPPTAVGRRP